MNNASKSLAQMKKATKLVQLAFRKNGPKSFTRGQGALLNALYRNEGARNRDDLIWIMGCNRSELKAIVKKATRNGFVTFEDDKCHGYAVKLTDEGAKIAKKRANANDRTAEQIVDCLSKEELAQLDAITEKLILSCKDKGVSGKKKGYKYNCCECAN